MRADRVALAFMLWLAGASLAEYPERPIRLLLPFPASGAVDIAISPFLVL
jgi:tripartite-type tricarboxylate transporter receptor subunit TctC